MHPDLSGHLHSPECNRLIAALLQCHQENKFKKFLGACNDANTAMMRCLKAERKDRQKANLEKAKARQSMLREKAAAEKASNN